MSCQSFYNTYLRPRLVECDKIVDRPEDIAVSYDLSSSDWFRSCQNNFELLTELLMRDIAETKSGVIVIGHDEYRKELGLEPQKIEDCRVEYNHIHLIPNQVAESKDNRKCQQLYDSIIRPSLCKCSTLSDHKSDVKPIIDVTKISNDNNTFFRCYDYWQDRLQADVEQTQCQSVELKNRNMPSMFSLVAKAKD